MKIKLLRKVRKQYDYRFCSGKLIVRNKATGQVDEYEKVNTFVENWCHSEFGYFTYASHREKRTAKVNDKTWRLKWQQANDCSQIKTAQ